jgi:hypothetical protein
MKKLYEEAAVQDIADAIREKTGGAETYKIAQMGNAVRGITTGATITDGIVVKERNVDGYATVVDFYGTDIHVAQFYGGNAYGAAQITPFKYLTTINTKNAVTFIDSYGLSGLPNLQPQGLDLSHVERLSGMQFGTGSNSAEFALICPQCVEITENGCRRSGITSASFPALTKIGNGAFADCERVKVISIPKITALGIYTSAIFKNCKAMETLDVGSIGHAVTSWGSGNFDGCTQAGLVITMHTTGAKTDALIASIRDGATNATIIIKAAEDTTYGGKDYAAGDTIITSTPEVTA